MQKTDLVSGSIQEPDNNLCIMIFDRRFPPWSADGFPVCAFSTPDLTRFRFRRGGLFFEPTRSVDATEIVYH